MTITEEPPDGRVRAPDNQVDADIDKVFAIFPRLKERSTQLAGTMSGGEQQMLAMGRALMARPKGAAARRAVDGPVADHGRQDLRGRQRHPRPWRDDPARREQNASRALQLASRGYVMDSGEITMGGDAKNSSTTRRCAPPTSAVIAAGPTRPGRNLGV